MSQLTRDYMRKYNKSKYVSNIGSVKNNSSTILKESDTVPFVLADNIGLINYWKWFSMIRTCVFQK